MVVILCLQHLQPLVAVVVVLVPEGLTTMVEQVALVVVEETKAETALVQQVLLDKVMQVVVLVDSLHQITQLAVEVVQAQQVLTHQTPQLVEPGA
jgi:hypothetical protein